MAHDHLSVKTETGRATAKLIATMLGGVLVLASFLAALAFGCGRSPSGAFYRDVLAAVGALLLAVPLWGHALKALFTGHLHMDELVALAILAAMAKGEYQTAGVVAFFLLISILIETRTALGARAAIEGLVRLTPTKARRLRDDGTQEEVEAHALLPGDIVLALPGDNVPADGQIIEGHSTINEANITGESLPAEKVAGDEVFGGTNNVTGAPPHQGDQGRARHDAGARAGSDPRSGTDEDPADAVDRPVCVVVYAGHADDRRRGLVLHAGHEQDHRPPGDRVPVCADSGHADGDCCRVVGGGPAGRLHQGRHQPGVGPQAHGRRV